MEKGLIIFFIVLILLGGLIIYGGFYIVIYERNNLKICADKLGYEFNWKMGVFDLSFTTKFINRTNIACCFKEKFITSEGILANKCILADV